MTLASRLLECPARRSLQAHYEKLRNLHLRQLFAEERNCG